MILDLMSRFNTINYNLKFAKVFGVYSSIYLSMLIDISSSTNDNDIKLSRQEIFDISGIELDTQECVERDLQDLGILDVSHQKYSIKNTYKLNIPLIIDLFNQNFNESTVSNIKTAKLLKNANKTQKQKKEEVIVDNLKKAITTPDSQSRQLLESWIDEVYTKKSYLSKSSVEFMESTLREYANKSVTTFRKLCELASRLVYVHPKWVIMKYEDDNKQNSARLNNVTQEEIDNNIAELKNYSGEVY